MEKKTSILIVDDDASLRKSLSFILKRKGFAVATAEGGLEAIEKVTKGPFEIIFMDIKMPQMNGVEAYRKIKKIRPEAVVVMITAYAVEDLVQEARKEGAHGILYKPLDVEDVLNSIELAREDNHRLKVLVVDDDPGICVTLKNMLTRSGFKVDIAHTGEEAIAMEEKDGYGLIFLDLKLPTINGLETYLALKKISPDSEVIIMTGHGQEMEDLVEHALAENAYACLYKPFDIEEMFGLIDEIKKMKRKAV